MELVFDTKGNDKQKQVCRHWLDNTVSRIVYGGSKGSGKSYLGCSLIFGDAYIYPGTHYFISRTSLTDLRKFTIPSIYEVFGIWGINDRMFTFNGQDNYFKLNNNSRVYLLDAKYLPSDPLYMRFGSMQMTRGWIEEAGEFEEEAANNLGASIGRWKNTEYNLPGKMLETCNPSKNYLYRDFYKKHKNGELEQWKRFVQAFPEDNKQLPAGYLENLNRILAYNAKQRLLFGNWEYDDDPSALCDYDAICDIFTNNHVAIPGDKKISADLAMKGRDRFVAGAWNGLVCMVAIDELRSDGKSIETSLTALAEAEHVGRSKIVADSDGMGSYLESYMKGIKEFHGNGRPEDEQYANIKAECAYKLAELINKRAIKVICTSEQKERIIEELGELKAMDINADEKKKRIVDKDQMKKNLGRSPDYLDMLIMGMYFEIKKSSTFVFSW